MKIILIKKGSKYLDAAISLEPIGKLEAYQSLELVRSVMGKILVDSRLGDGLSVEVYEVNPSVRYEVMITDYIKNKLRSKAKKCRWYSRMFRTPAKVQEDRELDGCWDMAELIAAAFKKYGYELLSRYEPHQVTPEMLSHSPKLFLKEELQIGN